MIITDLEFGLILTLIFALFIKGLKKKEEPEVFFSLDKSMSVGLKGISCILILIAHFYNMYHWNDNHSISWLHLSKICGNLGANIALVIFMFISGYGLSKSHYKMHIPADTRSAFPVISVQSPVSIQCCWQS